MSVESAVPFGVAVGSRAAGVSVHAAGTAITARPNAPQPSARATVRDVEDPIRAMSPAARSPSKRVEGVARRADIRESRSVIVECVPRTSIPALVALGALGALGATTLACGATTEPAVDVPIEVSASASAATGERAAPRRTLDLDAVSELDARTDALAEGPAMRARGATVEVRAPAEWTLDRGEASTSAEVEGAHAAIQVGGDDGTEQAIADAANALGVTACSWGPANDVAVGVDARPCSAVDGACARDGAPVRAALLRDAPGRLLVLGVWTERSDGLAIFASMRSLGALSLEGVAACCAALRQSAQSVPPNVRDIYIGAVAFCESAANDRAAIGALRGLLGRLGANVPVACR